ncbi:MAG: hypothetical protein LBI53_04675 [Candidatus Peribacteria bacterium]|nr:hypothetical protein [Candidatus Peribacteria bacterium]
MTKKTKTLIHFLQTKIGSIVIKGVKKFIDLYKWTDGKLIKFIDLIFRGEYPYPRRIKEILKYPLIRGVIVLATVILSFVPMFGVGSIPLIAACLVTILWVTIEMVVKFIKWIPKRNRTRHENLSQKDHIKT